MEFTLLEYSSNKWYNQSTEKSSAAIKRTEVFMRKQASCPINMLSDTTKLEPNDKITIGVYLLYT